MAKSPSTALILRGIAALILGIMALAWPGITVYTLVILSVVFAFIAAGLQAVLAFSGATGGPAFGYLLLGLADLAAGVILLAWAEPTARLLVLVVGSWAIFVGLFEVFVTFQAGKLAGSRAPFILGGLGAVSFGVSLFARPAIGAVTIALLFGMFSLINGSSMVMQGIGLRQTAKAPHSAGADAHTPHPRQASGAPSP
jgi:uncharacterized membrane protein HdeD (DUF308 family)